MKTYTEHIKNQKQEKLEMEYGIKAIAAGMKINQMTGKRKEEFDIMFNKLDAFKTLEDKLERITFICELLIAYGY